jgi:hypothetical protein
MLSRTVLRFLWPYGSMEMDSGGTMDMALWHYGTKAREGGIGLRRGEMVSGGYG